MTITSPDACGSILLPYEVDAIANEFLDGRFGEISPMKLQKLVYYAHAWSLALFNEPLIDDRIEAWDYGPVVPSLYHEFSDYGNQGIDRFAIEFDDQLKEITPRVPESDKKTKALLERIWEVFGEYTAIQLSNLTHSENEPWFKIPKKRPGLAIPDALIRDCFKSMLLEKSGA